MKELEGLRIRQRSVERLGCIKGCLEYLGSDVSFPWLYGGTGHAFIISLDPGVDVSSPDSWNHQPQFDLGRNLGYRIEGFSVWKPDHEDVFPQRQREAWDFVRGNIDCGVPCFGFELKKFYGGFWVIYGYDGVGYYYSGWEDGGPLPWQELGQLFVLVLEVRSVQLCDPVPAEKAVKDGLTFALMHAENPPDLIDSAGQIRASRVGLLGQSAGNGQGEARPSHVQRSTVARMPCRWRRNSFKRLKYVCRVAAIVCSMRPRGIIPTSAKA